MKQVWFLTLLAAALTACAGAANPSPPPPPPLPTLSSAGSTFTLAANGSATLAFSANDAPSGTTVVISPLPLPTPKFPLPDVVEGYAVTLDHTVNFSTFPPTMCVAGSFDPKGSYWLVVRGPGSSNAQISAAPSSRGLCTLTTALGGQMLANAEYDFSMMMATNATLATPTPSPSPSS